jgi:hypothetical protein
MLFFYLLYSQFRQKASSWINKTFMNVDSSQAVWILTQVMLYIYWLQSCCINIAACHIYTAWLESIFIQHGWNQYLYSMAGVNIYTGWLVSIFKQHDLSQYSYSLTGVNIYFVLTFKKVLYWDFFNKHSETEDNQINIDSQSSCMNIDPSHVV